MGHIQVVFQSPGNGNLVAHRWFRITEDNQVHGVVKPCTFNGHLQLCLLTLKHTQYADACVLPSSTDGVKICEMQSVEVFTLNSGCSVVTMST